MASRTVTDQRPRLGCADLIARRQRAGGRPIERHHPTALVRLITNRVFLRLMTGQVGLALGMASP
jgi:hypothetical protein